MKFNINEDIKKSNTLPADFYTSEDIFEQTKETVFAKCWHWITTDNHVASPGSVYPFNLYERFLDEPLLFTRDKNKDIHCLSNVCTHRGNLLVSSERTCTKLMCEYHGRRFGLDGKFEFMPEFGEAENFPCSDDHLTPIPFANWMSHLFVSLEPAFDFSKIADVFNEKVGFLPVQNFKLDSATCRDYLVNANWALYCDNYLEGFHIPFVHKDLNAALNYSAYDTEIHEFVNVQVGVADESTITFDLPKDHVDYGKNIAAYYFWVFPNMMFNFYPWGLSINVVRPLAVDRCKVSFITYMYDQNKIEDSAGADIDKVEREDEVVVEAVQKGLRSRFYTKGRFSPTKEKGVHHFHSLLSRFLEK